MNRILTVGALTGVLVVLLALPGCIERKERITVGADGRVEIEVAHETDSHAEMYLGDPVPTIDRGWIVEEWTDEDAEGKPIYRLKARAAFPADAPLPFNYAAVPDPDPGIALQFPTSLRIEERRDGVYYHFRRVYKARPWAFIDNPSKIVHEHIRKVLDDREFEDLPPGEQAALVEALINLEVLKFSAFAQQAFVEVTPEAPQDAWLVAREAIRAAADAVDVERILDLLGGEEEPANENALEEESKAFQDAATRAMHRALRESGVYGDPQLRAFAERFEHYRRYHEITEELGDDSFAITVEMPGTIVGHNADEQAGATVTWRFNGQFLRDRDHELMVTSRVPF